MTDYDRYITQAPEDREDELARQYRKDDMASHTCSNCGCRFAVLDDEQGDHACPRCGWAPWLEQVARCHQCGRPTAAEDCAETIEEWLCWECASGVEEE